MSQQLYKIDEKTFFVNTVIFQIFQIFHGLALKLKA